MSVAAAAISGLLLFAVLAGRVPLGRVAVRLPGALGSWPGAVLLVGALVEEAAWRGLLLGSLSPWIGVVPAFAAATAGFALAHVPRGGSRAARVHLATGGVFGACFLAGGLPAAACAHAVYNVAVLAGVRAVAASRESSARVLPGTACPGEGGGRSNVRAGTPPVAELRDVVKRFRGRAALGGVSLAVAPGEIVALLGPNGSGKTTAVALLTGLRRPDEGEALLFGAPPWRTGARAAVGVVPQEVGLPPTLRVREVVDLAARHFPAAPPPSATLARLGLLPLAERQAGGLSGGERRLVAVALALAGAPRLLVLDEPTAALDLTARRAVREAVRSHAAGGGAVLLTTHDLDEAEALADRAVVLARGVVVAEGETGDLRAQAPLRRIRLPFAPPDGLPGILSVERRARAWVVLASDAEAVLGALADRGHDPSALAVEPARLEDALAELAERAG